MGWDPAAGFGVVDQSSVCLGGECRFGADLIERENLKRGKVRTQDAGRPWSPSRPRQVHSAYTFPWGRGTVGTEVVFLIASVVGWTG